MATTTHVIVSKLWNLFNVLKDDRVTDHQDVTELTHLLVLKHAKGTGQEQGIPPQYHWDGLESLQGFPQLERAQESGKLTKVISNLFRSSFH